MFQVFKVVHNKFTIISNKGQNEIIGKNHTGACLYGELPKWRNKEDTMKLCVEGIYNKCFLFK